jgi:acetyl-CoA acetyltransferase
VNSSRVFYVPCSARGHQQHPTRLSIAGVAKLPALFQKDGCVTAGTRAALSLFIYNFNRSPISVHFCSCHNVRNVCVATIMNAPLPPGNASGISDGAGAIVLASESAASKHNLKPIARVLGYHISGTNAFSVEFVCLLLAPFPILPPAVIHFA